MVCKMGGKWLYNCCFCRVLLSVVVQNSMQHSHSFYLAAFSSSVSLESMLCSHTVVLTRLQLERISLFILSKRSDFHMVDNLSIVVYALPIHMLTSLSVDEILLPRYMNCSTNFRGLQFNEMVPSWLKHELLLISKFWFDQGLFIFFFFFGGGNFQELDLL